MLQCHLIELSPTSLELPGVSAVQSTMLVGIGTSEEHYNDAAVAIAFGTFKGQEDHMKELLGEDYYVDALKVSMRSISVFK